MFDFQDMPGHLIRRLHQISVSIFADGVASEGIDITPVQFAALYSLMKRPRIDQATLAGLIAYDRVTIGGVVDRLVQKNLVVREINPSDRRARSLALTEEGEELLHQAAPVISGFQDKILGGLSAEEQEVLIALLKKTTRAGNELSRAPLRDVNP